MPIGKLDQTKHKPSSLETLSSTDSTLESRISSNDIPKMELLKINYVSQTKQTVAATRSSPPATRSSADHHVVSSKCRVDGDVGRVYKYLGYMRPNSHPEISKKESHYESWDFLQNKRAIPTAPVAACEDCRDCCSECSDCSSTTADSLCFSPAVEKSLSWNYRTKLSAVKKQGQCGTSRAERYRKIDKIDCGHDVVRMRPLRQPVATKSCSDVSKIQQMFEQQRNQAMKRESMEPLRKSNSRQADSPRRRTFSPSGSDERIKKLDGLYDSDCCECTRGRKSLNEPKSVSKIPKKVEKNVDPKVSSRNFVRESKTEEQFSRREKMLMDYKSHNEPKEQLSRREKDLSKAPTELQQQFNRWDKKLAESKSHGELKDLHSRNVSKEFHAQRELQDELVRRDKKLVDFKALVDSKDRQSKQIDHSNHQRHSKKVVELPLHGVHLRSKDPKELVSWQTRKSPDKSEPRNESNEQFNRQIQKMFQSSQDCSSSSAQQVRITRPRGENHVESITPTDEELPTLLDAKILRKRIDKSKVERIHIRKKRQPLLIVNQLSESAQPNDHEKPSNTNIKYPEIDQSSKSRNTCGYKNCTYVDCPMSSSDHPKIIDSEADHAKKVQELVKDNNMKNLEKSTIPSDKIICNSPTIERKKLSSADEDHNRMKDQITIVINRQSDPNDVQNFSNKNLTKATTDELLSPSVLNNTIVIKSSSKTKMSNVDVNLKNIENRKFNDLKNINHWIDPEIVDHHRSHEHSSANSVKIFVRNYPVSCSSSADSNSLSDADDRGRLIKRYDSQQTASGSSCVTLSSSSVADEDDDDEDDLDDDDSTGSALSGDLQKYQSDGSSNCSASVTISSATGTTIQNVFPPSNFGCDGGFWNNCYFYDADKSHYCCSAISCDDDNCPYYDLEEDDQVDGCRQEPPQPDAVQHKRNPQKTDVIHDMRPRSMDGVVDSGVSLNGDTGSSPDSEHMQNQQDLEARRLKRGHVLSELLETERIYVTEMSSILKGYCDQMQSEEMMHLVPASLQGKEDILFGNLHEMYTFHSEIFLKDLENCISTTELVALCFVQRRDTFYRLYSFYCQNIPRSERLRETLVDTHLFLQECQKRLGHKLPLAAYLLKPVQRITKYQLLLKDLLRFSDSGSCTKELQKALDCMLIVLKCVNDSMHQIAITGFPSDLSQQGELLLQDSFQVWTESKKDIRLRIKPQQRHIFLYQKSMLFCKQTSKMGHNKSTYQFKHYVKMSQIGLTESVRGDPKRFEVWLQGRQEVHTLQAPTIDVKNKWVAEVKRVLFNQLQELKGEKIKQYSLNHRGLQQTASWDTPNSIISTPQRTMSCDASSESNRNSNCSSDDSCPPHTPGVSSISSTDKENPDGCGWSSDYSNSEDEMSIIEDNSTPTFLNILAQWAYNHDSGSYPRANTNSEGWTPAAYLESINRKSSRSSSRNQERAVNLININ